MCSFLKNKLGVGHAVMAIPIPTFHEAEWLKLAVEREYMSAAARIKQSDVARVCRAVRLSGHPNARLVIRLEKQEIEVILDGSGENDVAMDEWCDDDI